MDAIFFEKLLKQEQKALACAWEAFISLQREGKVPYPALYSQLFTRLQSKNLYDEPELIKVLSEGCKFLKELLFKAVENYEKEKKLKVEFSKEEIERIKELQSKLQKLEQEVSFLQESVLKDPTTGFWNRLGLQRIFDHVVKPHIYSEDYCLVVFFVIMPKEEDIDLYEEKIMLASANFIKNFFSPRDFLTRPGSKLIAVITVGQDVPTIKELIQVLANRKFPCYIKDAPRYIKYMVGGTNILGMDYLNVAIERAVTAAQQNRFIRV